MDNLFLKRNKVCIHIIALGGTIACTSENNLEEFYSAPSTHINQLISLLPLDKEKFAITSEQILQQISHEMTNEDLIFVAKRVNELVNADYVDGIVITQGTNCIEEMSSQKALIGLSICGFLIHFGSGLITPVTYKKILNIPEFTAGILSAAINATRAIIAFIFSIIATLFLSNEFINLAYLLEFLFLMGLGMCYLALIKTNLMKENMP
ncbi:MAG: asparaginase [Gammaproteobacteria bacterium]|nr:asparaginase [Gammaproteobacteria bacterium]